MYCLPLACDEARPICEYCSHTGRRCLYPDVFEAFKEGQGPVAEEVREIYSSPESMASAESTPFEDDAFSDSRQFTFQVLLGSAASHLQISRFELRVLRFFNDICLPHFTYNVNKRQVRVWSDVVPSYFIDCPSIKSAILATGCLSMMPFLGVQKVIDDNMSEEALSQRLEETCGSYEIQQMFADDYLFDEDSKDINLFTKASTLLSESINATNTSMASLQSPDLTSQEKLPHLVSATIGNSLLFGFLGLQPWKLAPLVHFPEENEAPKTDLLNVAVGLRMVVVQNLPSLLSSDIAELYHNDELMLIPRRKIKIVEDLKAQLDDYLQGAGFGFFDIDSDTSRMINVFRDSLVSLEKVCALAVKFNYPVMLFRWLLIIDTDFVTYVRSKNRYALRLLYVYACLCVHYKFWLFESSVWRDHVMWYRSKYGPLCEFDERLYHYVVTRRKYVLNDNYRSIKDFDVWSSEFDY
ncbi:hypothetical protein FT663_03911 [Candidozyma haemuli var. vulneris]|nr:hypothetical protein FT662_03984 [[Candida] haemuloni var. vulneris]KAF3988743.1 hypothetical protein FT663_03911 [[Candida] haemuloni var. vulneris]